MDKHKKTIWCRLGLHDWYKGNFSYPVWGRYERHCLDCNKIQYYDSGKWITFIRPPYEATEGEQNG
jgi:hypothetical protein